MTPPARSVDDVPAKRSGPIASAGIALWRRPPGSHGTTNVDDIQILLVHPGGPFWAHKDEHAWSIPKGEFDPEHERPLDAARREFEEEMGAPLGKGDVAELRPFRAGRKRLHPFAVQGDFDTTGIDPSDVHRSVVTMEWPPRSGTTQTFCEIDRAEWVRLVDAPSKLHKGQRPLVDALRALFDEVDS